MRHVRMLGLCLAAVFVVVAVMAAGASAQLPEWGKCEATTGNTGGKFGNGGCTAPVKAIHGRYLGSYEWYPLQQLGQEEEATELEYTDESPLEQPVSSMTLTLASGKTITCGALAHESYILLSDTHVTTQAPRLHFLNCVDEQGGECHTTDAGNGGEITTKTAWRAGIEHEPGSWTGTMSFIEGRAEPEPKVDIVYKTEEPRGRFLQELVCESSEPLTIVIGGHKENEAITATITPVDRMSSSFTAGFGPAAHKVGGTRPLEAQVNTGAWEPISFDTMMLLPEMYIAHENVNYSQHELELKAMR